MWSSSLVICQLTWKIAEEIDFENGRISNFQCHVTLTLTLDQAIWHTLMHHSSLPTYQISLRSDEKIEGHISIFFQVQGRVTQKTHVTQKLGELSKIRPEQI